MGVIGIDLGGTKVAGAIFNDKGDLLHRALGYREERTGKAVAALIQRQISSLQKIARTRKIKLRAIGICVPGVAHTETGRVWAPNIPGWRDYPLRDELVTVLTDRRIPVVVENDRAAYILGETWKGAARGCRNAIFLAVGTGIGAGIIVNGEVLRGARGIAGAIGWLALDRRFRSEYAGCGCFEYHASGDGLVKVANQILRAKKKYRGPLRNRRPLTARDIFTASKQGDIVATAVLSQAVEFWGLAAANLVSLFNPEKIIFGGGVFGPAVHLIEDIYSEAKKWSQPISIQQVRFEASQLGSDAGLYGAGFLALRGLRRSR